MLAISEKNAKLPEQTQLTGRIVSLVPLDPEIHGEALYQNTHGEGKEHVWDYMPWGPFHEKASFDTFLKKNAASLDPLYFAIVDKTTHKALGFAAYLRIEPVHRVIEVGCILYIPIFQRTVGSTEAMYLMARYAFEELGYRRYEWKCNALNKSSRNAALRLGFTFEGIFRQHLIIKGCNRDTAWYSMLDSEWPSRKAAFEQWLDPSNFDEAGCQKISLGDLNNNEKNFLG